jgi:rhamnosyltransferase
MEKIKISIVIPVKNGEKWLSDLFKSLLKQTLIDQCEIIVIDSGSSDKSESICKEFGVSFYKIQSTEFNHGTTRNYGVSLSKGKFILMTVQDAIPVNDFFLEELLKGFKSPEVKAVCGLQIVPNSRYTNPMLWHNPTNRPQIRFFQFSVREEFEKLSPEMKKNICSWDNVCALYLRDALIEVPFKKISFGEDMAWCKEAILNGYKICYNSNAKVFHYHKFEKKYAYKRYFSEMYAMYSFFNFIPQNKNIFDLIKIFYHLMVKPKINFIDRFYWLTIEIQDFLVFSSVRKDLVKNLKRGGLVQLDSKLNSIKDYPSQAPFK